jgi:predicted anti-sigma-YlaC factor YlaD
MNHDTWTDRLSEYVDGDLDMSTMRALEAHLAGCADCRAVADDLRNISARGRALPLVPPAADLWPGIESRMHQSGIVPIRVATRRSGLFVSWPRLAAAGLLLGLVSGGAVYAVTRFQGGPEVIATIPLVPANGTTTAPTELQVGAQVNQSTAEAVSDLQMILASEKLDSATVRILTLNLARIDSAIADAERALAADPSNAYVSRHLASTARRKVELLHLVAGLTQSRS